MITTTSTDEKAAKARDLGADEVINYSEEDIAQRVKELTGGQGADLVLDHVGADFWPAAVASWRSEAATASAALPQATRPSFRWG